MEIFPVSIPQITVPTQISATTDFQFNVPADSNFKISEKSGPSSIDSFVNNELEESVVSDSNESQINSGLEETGDDDQSSAVNEVNSEGQAVEKEAIDPLMLAIYSGSLTNENINVDDIEVEVKADAITVNTDSNLVDKNQLEIPAEEILSENKDDAVIVDKKYIAAPPKDDTATLEAELDMNEDVTVRKEESNTDLEYLFSEEEDASDLENVEFESEKFAKLNLTEDSQDADPEEEIHIRTDHGRQSKSGQDSDKSSFDENRQHSTIFQNKIATEGAGQFPPDSLIKNVEKLTPERAPVSHIDTEPVNTNAIERTDAFTESSRSTGSIFTKNAARAAGFNEVLDRIVYVIRGNNRLGVSVEHDLLGKININLSMEKGMVHVHINATEKVTSEFIENHLHYLMDELSKEGVNVGGFSFGMADGNNEEGEDSGKEGSMGKDYETGHDGPGNRTGLISIFA
jgi:hypothetical protein